jgi:hypothetical protein
MRTLLITLLLATPAFAQERTWTIATAVVTTEAELVGVRGDVVYLKIDDKIESVPLARLSVADHEYIASLSLAPVRSGPTVEGLPSDDLRLPSLPEELTPPVNPSVPTATSEALPLPPAAAAVGGAADASAGRVPAANAQTNGNRTTAYRATAPTATQTRETTAARRAAPPNQLQSAPRGNTNSNPGILGIRGRREDRQRGR